MAKFTSFGENWKKEKHDKEVTLYTTSVPGSLFKAYKVEAEFTTTLTALAAHQKDADNYINWMDGLKSSELVEDTGETYCTHSIVPAPWPVKDRDSIVTSSISQDPDTLEVYIRFQHDNNRLPPQKGCERVEMVNGEWIFTPIMENGQFTGRVKLSYINHVNPGGKIPSWLANNFAIDVPFKSIKSLVKDVQQAKYQQAELDFIKEPELATA